MTKFARRDGRVFLVTFGTKLIGQVGTRRVTKGDTYLLGRVGRGTSVFNNSSIYFGRGIYRTTLYIDRGYTLADLFICVARHFTNGRVRAISVALFKLGYRVTYKVVRFGTNFGRGA